MESSKYTIYCTVVHSTVLIIEDYFVNSNMKSRYLGAWNSTEAKCMIKFTSFIFISANDFLLFVIVVTISGHGIVTNFHLGVFGQSFLEVDSTFFGVFGVTFSFLREKNIENGVIAFDTYDSIYNVCFLWKQTLKIES